MRARARRTSASTSARNAAKGLGGVRRGLSPSSASLQFQLGQLASEDGLQAGREAEDAACDLPADGRHHELQVPVAVAVGEDAGDQFDAGRHAAPACSGVKATATVSGLRVVKLPMSRRRVRLMRGEKV